MAAAPLELRLLRFQGQTNRLHGPSRKKTFWKRANEPKMGESSSSESKQWRVCRSSGAVHSSCRSSRQEVKLLYDLGGRSSPPLGGLLDARIVGRIVMLQRAALLGVLLIRFVVVAVMARGFVDCLFRL